MHVHSLSELPEWAQKQLREKLNLSPSLPSNSEFSESIKKVHTLHRSQLEKAFMGQVLELADLHGWLSYHSYDSRRSTPGFPDLVMVRNKTLIFAELKTAKGKPSKEQTKWLEALSQVETVSSHIWKPSNWQEIEGVLRRKNVTKGDT
jgi:hypothetical protein